MSAILLFNLKMSRVRSSTNRTLPTNIMTWLVLAASWRNMKNFAGWKDLLMSCQNCKARQSSFRAWLSPGTCSSRTYSKVTHYDVLGVRGDATSDQIKTAFIKKSKQLHPDKNSQDTVSHEKFVRLNEAYMTLSKPGLRREYDLRLAVHLHQHLNQQSRVYHNRSHGNNWEAGEKVFWDETTWQMRDEYKDKYYEEKGVNKSYRIHLLFVVIIASVVLRLFAIKYTMSVSDKRSKEAGELLMAARRRGKENENLREMDLEYFKSRLYQQERSSSK